jgi:hypothetical protein
MGCGERNSLSMGSPHIQQTSVSRLSLSAMRRYGRPPLRALLRRVTGWGFGLGGLGLQPLAPRALWLLALGLPP